MSEEEMDDLALIPANVQGFGTVRLAELWKSPAMRKALNIGDDLNQTIYDETTLFPDMIERVSGVAFEVERRGLGVVVRTGWTIVRAAAPYEFENIPRRLVHLGNPQEVSYQDRRYYRGTAEDGRTYAAYFASPRVMVIGPEDGVKRCLDFVKTGPVKGPLEPIIALAASGKHTAVAGISPPSGNTPWTGDFAGVQLITATLDVGDSVTLVARGETRSEIEAKELVTGIKRYRKLSMAALAGMQLFAGKDQRDKTASLLSLLKQVQVEQKGRDVFTTARIEDGGSAAKGLLALPQILGR
jgi:hypothetical protein